ncbi:MAG: NAD-dependent epimerase/dehydratase family protein, partial [Patescibacteria group bacterium]
MNNTLELARQYKAKYLFASSSVVYGPPQGDNHRFKEEDEGVVDHMSSRACYDEGKRFGETYVDTYRQVYGVDVRLARIFRTYGPRMQLREGHLMPDFIIDALDGKALVIYGDEKFSTSVSYVSDVVDALLRLMHVNEYLGPVNIGDDKRYLMSEIAQKIIAMTNSSSQIRYEPPIEFLTPLGLPDLTKAREELGWVPLVRLEDGLRKTIDYTIANKDALGVGK